MPLTPPNLDDRRFPELFEELRSLIPRYAPEWTDHNLSDPGISLMQLFAHLGEIILYRLNQVPDLHYIKFLQLIGVEQKPAFPAQAELTFTLTSPNLTTVIIPRGTRIGAQIKPPAASATTPPTLPPAEEEPVVFETEEPLYAMGMELKYVQVFDGINYSDFSVANQPKGDHYYAFGRLARDNSALLIGFASNNAFPSVEINLTVRLFVDPNIVKEYSCNTTDTAVYPPASISWEYWNGAEWRRLIVLKDETYALTRSGHVYFQGPKDIKKAAIGGAKDPVYWIRCHLVVSHYERSPELDAVLINTVSAKALVTVRDEVVGSSNGLADQLLRLRHTPVFAKLPYPIEQRLQQQQSATPTEQLDLDRLVQDQEVNKGFLLEVDEGAGSQTWQEVEDFFNSNADDRHYVLNRATGEIRFGDGQQGKIPVAGSNNLIARYYRYGGGLRGNVGADMITELQTSVPDVDKVTNYWTAEGGADEELVKDAKARAPKELKARDRAVTVQDFEFLARQTPGVRIRRAWALPLYHPQFPFDVQVPGVITVIVVPESEDFKPLPSEGTLKTVCEYLDQRRLLTTEVFVAPPKYKHVKIEAMVAIKPTADLAKVKLEVENKLNTYLHPLTGGEDEQGWTLGGDVIYSNIFRVILQVEGVGIVEDMQIVIDDRRIDRCENAAIPKDYLVYSDGHDINVTYTPSQI
jgi:Baseplate J-like protein